MNNPDDDTSPRGDKTDVDPDMLREAADRDDRSQVQRNHDALTALLQAATDGGLLGASHRGLPPHIIISMTEDQLRQRAGVARTATGTDLPISNVLTLAARAQLHLAVFDDHTGEPLFLGRAHRLASQSQRFIAFAKYGGCSRHDCPTPFAHTEMHHAEKDWADGGRTDANHMAPACGPHNRSVGPEPGQWETVKITDGPYRGRYGWRRNTDPTRRSPHQRPPPHRRTPRTTPSSHAQPVGRNTDHHREHGCCRRSMGRDRLGVTSTRHRTRRPVDRLGGTGRPRRTDPTEHLRHHLAAIPSSLNETRAIDA